MSQSVQLSLLAPTLRTPHDGQRIHLCDIDQYDLTGFRTSWGPDNYAVVRRIEQDITGMVRCNLAASCQNAAGCAFARPHKHDGFEDGNSNQCYDHKPYQPGGVRVWAEVCR